MPARTLTARGLCPYRRSANITVPVSGSPYGAGGLSTRGSLAVSPSSGLGLSTAFTLSASDWFDTDLPLQYSFAYSIAGNNGSDSFPLVTFGPQSSVSVTLPAGLEAGGYMVNVQVQAQNVFGVVSPPVVVPVKVRIASDPIPTALRLAPA